MEGPHDRLEEDMEGVIPRAVKHIFDKVRTQVYEKNYEILKNSSKLHSKFFICHPLPTLTK